MKVLETTKTQYKVSDFVSWQRAKTLVLCSRSFMTGCMVSVPHWNQCGINH